MSIPTITKTPDEKYAVGLKYIAPDLASGETITSCVVSIDPDEDPGLKKVGAVIISSDQVEQLIESGVANQEYYVKFKTTTSGNNTYEDKIFVKVRA